MSTLKKCKVVMLPTEKASNIWKDEFNQLYYKNQSFFYKSGCKYQHLYIISDDEIKDDDWFILLPESKVRQARCHLPTPHRDWKKIIATTDLALINNDNTSTGKWINRQLPQPSQSFIEKYIELYNSSPINEFELDVMVEYDEFIPNNGVNLNGGYHSGVKVNPRDNTITIRRVKDSYTREEIEKAFEAGMDHQCDPSTNPGFHTWIDKL